MSSQQPTATPVICPTCRGERRVKGYLCPRCNGDAQIPRSQMDPGETAPFETTPDALLSAGELDALEKMERKATPGPWQFIPENEDRCSGIDAETRANVAIDPTIDDGLLIVEARNLLPRLLASYRAQEAQLAGLRAQVERQAMALKPFDTIAGSISVGCHDKTPVAYVDDTLGITCGPKKTELTAGEFRAIRAALPLPPDLGERK